MSKKFQEKKKKEAREAESSVSLDKNKISEKVAISSATTMIDRSNSIGPNLITPKKTFFSCQYFFGYFKKKN